MPRYIDKDELVIWLNAVDGIIADGTVHPQTLYKQIITDIENFGSADVVEIVRCKDCVWYKKTPWGDEMLCQWWTDWIPTDPNDFCSCGEKKEQP